MPSRSGFVCDKYNPLSLKDFERRRHSIFPGYLLRALIENQKTPIQFRKFFMSGKNKESLVLFMPMHWKKLVPEEFHRRTMFASLSQRCFMLCPQHDTNEEITETLQELTADHEAADTLLLLHAKHASTACSSIIIKTPDTDDFLLCLAQQHKLSVDLYVVTSTSRWSCLISVRSIAENCRPVVSSALLSLRAITDCDSVSFLRERGK